MSLQEIKEIIEEERNIYVPSNFNFNKLTHQKRYMIWRYLAYFRISQYWKECLADTQIALFRKLYAKVAYRYYTRKKNLYSEKCGVEISNPSKLGRRVSIWHGNVIINANLGDDCIIHGNNVLGNKGFNVNEIPCLGDRVDVGVGAVIIGKVSIASDCVIGANAVVTKSFEKKGSMIVGVPAFQKG